MEKSRENKKIYRAIGCMSGTSMDGIDVALIETDGNSYVKSIAFHCVSHEPILRQNIAAQLNKISYDKEVERKFTLAHAPVIESLLQQAGMTASDIDVIGFHGQTTHHAPDEGITVQMGDGQLLADETGIDVVYDLRSADVQAGGQGAPLLPVYHAALTKAANIPLPIVILNLGGVGNITWISKDTIIGFDTGPANAMIDDWMANHTDMTFDAEGKTAAKGTVDKDKLNDFLSHPYFIQPYPKSLDRNAFASVSVDDLSLEDGAATLTAMTVNAVAKGIALCPSKPETIYVTGGGRHNGFMMHQISITCECPVESVDTLKWNGDALEAEGFAYMAVRSLLGHPYSFPTTTGCTTPTCGGVHVQPKRRAA